MSEVPATRGPGKMFWVILVIFFIVLVAALGSRPLEPSQPIASGSQGRQYYASCPAGLVPHQQDGLSKEQADEYPISVRCWESGNATYSCVFCEPLMANFTPT